MLNKHYLRFFIAANAVIFLSFVAGSQLLGLSRDVGEYFFFFENLSVDYDGRFEPLFVYLSLIVKGLSIEFPFYLFILSLISLSLKVYVLSRYQFFYASLFWYLLILFPYHELTQYRVSIALGLLYLSFYMLSTNQKFTYSLLIFSLSVFFHYSAIAFLPIVLFWGVMSNANAVKFIYAVIAIIFLFVAKAAITSFVGELNSTAVFHESIGPNIFSARNIILCFLVIIGFFGFKSMPQKSRPFFYISIYGFILWWLFYDLPVFAHRLFETTFMSYFIWLSFMRGIYRLFSRVLMSTLALYLAYSSFYLDPLFS